MTRPLKLFGIAGATLLAAACSDGKQYATAACTLVDVSGTYSQQKGEVARIVKAGILPRLMPGDSLFLVAIDSNSYEEGNLLAQVTVDYVPSKASEQKLGFAKALDRFAASGARSTHTDISGAMMLCADRLRSTGAANQAIFVFSDMQEDLQKGLKREFKRDEFKGIHVTALNVIKLKKDAADPEVYRNRLRTWEKKLLSRGAATWEVILDPVRIPEYFDGLR